MAELRGWRPQLRAVARAYIATMHLGSSVKKTKTYPRNVQGIVALPISKL